MVKISLLMEDILRGENTYQIPKKLKKNLYHPNVNKLVAFMD